MNTPTHLKSYSTKTKPSDHKHKIYATTNIKLNKHINL